MPFSFSFSDFPTQRFSCILYLKSYKYRQSTFKQTQSETHQLHYSEYTAKPYYIPRMYSAFSLTLIAILIICSWILFVNNSFSQSASTNKSLSSISFQKIGYCTKKKIQNTKATTHTSSSLVPVGSTTPTAFVFR